MNTIAVFVSNGLYLIIALATIVFALMIIANIVIRIFTHHFSKACVVILIVSFAAMIGCSAIILVAFPETLESVENEEIIENDNNEGDNNYTDDQSNKTNNDNSIEEPLLGKEDEAQNNQGEEVTEKNSQKEMEEEQNKALQLEVEESIRKPVSHIKKVAKKYTYKLIISNIHKKDITEKYKKLSKQEKNYYRTVKVKEIDTEKHECKIIAATTKTLESKMKAKFKNLDKNDPLIDVYNIADDNGYKVIVRNRKGKRVDKKASFNANKYLYTSFKNANYDKNSVTINADTKAHVKKVKKKKAAEAKKRKLQKEKRGFSKRKGNHYIWKLLSCGWLLYNTKV